MPVEQDTPKTEFLHPGAIQQELEASSDHRTLYLDKKFVNRVVDAIARVVLVREIEVLSFDVFDTALLRSPASELRRFHTVSQAFGKENSIASEDLLMARTFAARAAYTHSPAAADGTREGQHADIAKITCDLVGMPNGSGSYIATEIECERKSLQANPLVTALQRRLPRLPVIFVSDMYLHVLHIQSLLGNSFGKKPVVFSSASGHGSKRCGGLYKHVAQHVNLPAEKFLHLGDSLVGDFQQARRSGWNAFYLPLPKAEATARRSCFDEIELQMRNRGCDTQDLTFNM